MKNFKSAVIKLQFFSYISNLDNNPKNKIL